MRSTVPSNIESVLRHCEQAAGQYGAGFSLDTSVLTERARLNGFLEGNHISANRACRLIEARDGWIAANLARDEDIDSVPAWIGLQDGDDIWASIENVARKNDVMMLVEQGQLLGIPVAPAYVDRRPDDVQFRGEAVKRTRITTGLCRAARKPLVIDLSSLWAGPLCGHLLAKAGTRVVKIESASRPDGARFGSKEFFDSLNSGKEQLSLDFKSEEGRAELWNWIERADVVIESARPRALPQLGFEPLDAFARNPFMTWISITAYGREGPWSNYVGFGDDAAAAGGLLTQSPGGTPAFIGDAIADPLAGILAAASAFLALSEGGGVLLDVSLREAAAHVARSR
jgi:hypothetical protein